MYMNQKMKRKRLRISKDKNPNFTLGSSYVIITAGKRYTHFTETDIPGRGSLLRGVNTSVEDPEGLWKNL